MGVAMASNLDTLNDFLDTINKPNDATWHHYHDVAHLLALFCDDHGDLPFVGITQRGPQFPHRNSIEKLFIQLLNTTFPDMAWKPANPLRMTDGDNIAIEVDVIATQHATWFQDKFRSLPLSQIEEDTIRRLAPKHNTMDIPACMVFTFDSDYKIQQLAIYMDRYKMMDQLAPKEWKAILLPEQRGALSGTAGVTETKTGPGRRVTITIEDC
jgi:hypothetical protein